MKPECWREWRGPDYGSNGSMTIRWAHENIDRWLKKHNPEVAVIMFGTNDLTQVEPKEYEQKTREVVNKCLKNGTVVILSTIPPRSGMLKESRMYADAAVAVARAERVPLIDYFGEILRRRPDDWYGTLAQFAHAAGGEYQVSTLIARDGVHPSCPRLHTGDFSDRALSRSGFGLRSYQVMLAYSRVIDRILATPAE